MAAIQDLLNQIQDLELRSRIEKEVEKLTKTKKFGLVFEEHLPECTPLYDVPIKRGSTVAKKTKSIDDIYTVISISNDIATCCNKVTNEKEDIYLENLVNVAQFGDPIYPYLKPIDSVCNSPESDLWHTLIEADNYHALQLLEYLYAGKVDCIYIDPPYNTGARDWKYNNDYVDGSDAYRHSKWLSMMEKRLRLAKKLLNPNDSVLIVTIDEKEYLHLGCLLEELFPEAKMQMVTSIIKPEGTQRLNEFSRTNEYIFFVMLGAFNLPKEKSDSTDDRLMWHTLRRGDLASRRGTVKGGKAQFYPIYIDNETRRITCVGDPIGPEVDRLTVPVIDGCTAVFPVRPDGTEMNWGIVGSELMNRYQKGYVRIGKYDENAPQQYVISYLKSGPINDIETGRYVVTGKTKDGDFEGYYLEGKTTMPKTVWNIKNHNARDYGSLICRQVLLEERFSFPKSIYAVKDALRIACAEKKNALILDFFAGSGTTLHAVNMLNNEDGGNRRCIMVTNNEVSEVEAKRLSEKGLHPGDKEWDSFGIAEYVTWPRTVCTIKGCDVKANPLTGYYLDNEGTPQYPMSDGFKSNAAFFKLGFLDKTAVAIGRQLSELIPVLWLKAGAHSACPNSINCTEPMIILPNNRFAILLDEKCFQEFFNEVNRHNEIQTIFIVTDSESGYKEMISEFVGKDTYQLYRDYLDNFRINVRRA